MKYPSPRNNSCAQNTESSRDQTDAAQHERELPLQFPARSASLEELRSLLSHSTEQEGRANLSSRSGLWCVALSVLLAIEVVAIVYQARWVPPAHQRLQQAVATTRSRISQDLNLAAGNQNERACCRHIRTP